MQAVSCNLKLKFFLYFFSGLCGSINPHFSAAQTTNALTYFWSWLQRGYCFYFCHGLSRLCHSRAESELRHLIKNILSQQHAHRKSISGHWKKQLYSCRLYIYDATIATCICMGIGTYLHTGSNKFNSHCSFFASHHLFYSKILPRFEVATLDAPWNSAYWDKASGPITPMSQFVNGQNENQIL